MVNEVYKRRAHTRKYSLNRSRVYIILCFFAPVCVFAVSFAIAGFFPFGENHVLYGDLEALYLPFLTSFVRTIRQGGSLFWSWEAGGGFDYWLNFASYFGSPLNLFLLLFEPDFLHNLILPLVLVKIGLAGLFFGLYLNKINGATFFLPLIATLYALSGFVLQGWYNIIYLDSIALFPLVMLGFRQFMREGRFRLYIVSLSVCLMASLNIGWYVCIFIFLSFFGESYILGFSFREILMKLWQIALLSLIAIGLGAFLLYPSILHLFEWGRVGSYGSVHFINSYIDVLATFAPMRQATFYVSNIPNIYCGILTLLGAGLFFGVSGIQKREKIVCGIFIVFLLLCANVTVLDFLINGLVNPRITLYRYLFLLVFVMCSASYRAFSMLLRIPRRNLVFLLVLCLPVLVCLLIEGEIYFVATFAIIAVYVISISSYNKNMSVKSRAACALVITALVFTELMMSARIIIREHSLVSYNDYVELNNSVESLLSERTGHDFYRTVSTEFFSNKLTEGTNHSLLYGFNSNSLFSSLIDNKTVLFFGGLGQDVVEHSTITYQDTSPLAGMFSAVRYVISDTEHVRSNFLKPLSEAGGITLYENEYYLPFGFMVREELSEYKSIPYDPITSQNDFYSKATGFDLLIPIEIHEVVPLGYSITQIGDLEYAFMGGGSVLFNYKTDIQGEYYGYCYVVERESPANDIFVVIGNKVFEPTIRGVPYLFSIGGLDEGQDIIYSVVPIYTTGIINVTAAYLDTETLKEGYRLLSQEPLEILEFTDTYIKGSIQTEGGLLYTSLPAKNWRAFVNGTETEIIRIDDCMAGLMLERGTAIIEFRYFNTNALIGFIISGATLIIFVFICFKQNRNQRG